MENQQAKWCEHECLKAEIFQSTRTCSCCLGWPMESCEMLKAKGMNTLVSRTIYTNGGMCCQGFRFTQQPFSLCTIDWLTDWLGRKHCTLLKGEGLSWKGSPGSLRGKKHWKYTFFFFPQQYLYNHHVTPASSITNLLLEEVNTYKRPRWKLRFCADWKTI